MRRANEVLCLVLWLLWTWWLVSKLSFILSIMSLIVGWMAASSLLMIIFRISERK